MMSSGRIGQNLTVPAIHRPQQITGVQANTWSLTPQVESEIKKQAALGKSKRTTKLARLFRSVLDVHTIAFRQTSTHRAAATMEVTQ
jgi:hypothetical protein